MHTHTYIPLQAKRGAIAHLVKSMHTHRLFLCPL